MKIVTLNMWQGRLGRALLKHLETLDVDFACMQEAVDYSGRSLGLVTSYQEVGESLKLDNQFFSQLMSTKLADKELAFGNVVYSRYPFLQTNTIFTRGNYTYDFNFEEEDYNIRAFQHVQVDIHGKKLHLLNHHGHHIDAHKMGDDETLRQVKQICDYITGLDGAVILCGDFNLAPESESIHYLNTHLTNLSAKYSLQTTRSQLTHKKEVCDYIFASQHIIINNFVMDTTIMSDHNALVLDFDLS